MRSAFTEQAAEAATKQLLTRALHALTSKWDYPILNTLKGGAVKVKRKVIAGVDEGGQRMGRMVL